MTSLTVNQFVKILNKKFPDAQNYNIHVFSDKVYTLKRSGYSGFYPIGIHVVEYVNNVKFIDKETIIKEFGDVILRMEFKDKKKLFINAPITTIVIEATEREWIKNNQTIKFYPMKTEVKSKHTTEPLINKYYENFKTPTFDDIFNQKPIEQNIIEIDNAIL